jgi:hypothetical protein
VMLADHSRQVPPRDLAGSDALDCLGRIGQK